MSTYSVHLDPQNDFVVVDRQTSETWVLPRHITNYRDGRLGMVINACREYEIAESMVVKET